MTAGPVGILLAAGQSRRFGDNKLLHPLIDDTPMLLVSAQNLVTALPGSFVVIHSSLLDYREPLQQLGLNVVVNTQAERGMGSSIACGVEAGIHAAGWLIALADMPFIRIDTLQRLADRLQQGAALVAPEYDGRRGHPVGFSQRYKNDLLELDGDVGARRILSGQRDVLELIPTDDAGVLRDIDIRDDLTPQLANQRSPAVD